MTAREDLIAQIEAFCRREGIAESTFGKLAINDPAFVSRLRGGKNIGLNTCDRVSKFIAAKRRAPSRGAAA